MNMKELYEEFVEYVANMSDQEVRKSISDAIEHTANSQILVTEEEKNEYVFAQTSVQSFQSHIFSSSNFMFSSAGVAIEKSTYKMSGREGAAA